ncbi:hypothetical protein [Rhizobium tumorigenes]|uniref:Uncharacterized protein n=1 Tax=Rhizobium tumorigenes TaxID=2041385 RepID=A0AAF1KAI8_9HYPH|nr:hypothetical protein [Rhizobium tumorigenes]WFR97639.1 hypothetical protein PR017_20845 [Rhizobium tumorigenes]
MADEMRSWAAVDDDKVEAATLHNDDMRNRRCQRRCFRFRRCFDVALSCD